MRIKYHLHLHFLQSVENAEKNKGFSDEDQIFLNYDNHGRMALEMRCGSLRSQSTLPLFSYIS